MSFGVEFERPQRLVLDTSAFSRLRAGHWIAAATLDCSGNLVTFDAHFEKIAGLPWTLLTP